MVYSIPTCLTAIVTALEMGGNPRSHTAVDDSSQCWNLSSLGSKACVLTFGPDFLETLLSTPRSILAYMTSPHNLPVDDLLLVRKAPMEGRTTSVLTCWPSCCKLWEQKNRFRPF